MRSILIGALSALLGTASTAGQFYISGSGPRTIGNGQSITVERAAPSPFDELEVQGPIRVEVTRGEYSSLAVMADSNLIELIETRVSGTTLMVGLKPDVSIETRGELRVTLKAPQIKRARLSGSGDVILEDLVQAEVRLQVRGSGDIVVDGTVNSAELQVQGSGDIRGGNLRAQRVDAAVQGSGDIRAYAQTAARAHVTGSGDIDIAGRPSQRDVRVVGSGNVNFD